MEPAEMMGLASVMMDFTAKTVQVNQEPLKLWTELYSELIPNGGLELAFLLLKKNHSF